MSPDPTQADPTQTVPAQAEPTQAVAREIARWRKFSRFVRSRVTWSRLYHLTSYLKSALWTVPLIAIAIEFMVAPGLRALDAWLHWRLAGLEQSGAQAMYQTVITLTLSFLVFTFGSLLVAIQIAGGQLTPRIIATTLLRDNVVRYSVGLFVFTLVFAVGALNRVDESAHELIALLTGMLGVACIADFLFLIDYAARLLRPVSVLARVGEEGLAVIKSVYQNPTSGALVNEEAWRSTPGSRTRVVAHDGKSEIMLAADLPTLVEMARRSDGIIELVHQVGDFVAADEPLFALHGGATAIPDRKLRGAVAFGSERTLEQDPIFAFRILVDIGLKALSRAINDPTTAVLAIDQLHRLLRVVGRRQLRAEIVRDDAGLPRVIFRTPNWEDFVHVACIEIRNCGADNLQVARRLRAMLQNLIESLPAHRHPELKVELERLDRTVERIYILPGELVLARLSDSQGLGGSSGSRTATPG